MSRIGKLSQATKEYKRVIESTVKIRHKQWTAGTRLNLASNLKKMGKFDEALTLLKQSLKAFQELEDKRGVYLSYANIAGILSMRGNNKLAVKYYEKSLEIVKGIGYLEGIGITEGNLGLVHFSLGNYNLAQKAYEKHLNISKKLKYKSGICICYGNLAELFRVKGHYNKAQNYLNKYIKLAREIKFARGEGEALIFVLKLKLAQKDYKGYEDSKKNVEDYFKREKDFQHYKIEAEKQEIRYLIDNPKPNLELADKLLKNFLKTTNMEETLGSDPEFLLCLGDVKFKMGKPKQALKQYEKILELFIDYQYPREEALTYAHIAELEKRYPGIIKKSKKLNPKTDYLQKANKLFKELKLKHLIKG